MTFRGFWRGDNLLMALRIKPENIARKENQTLRRARALFVLSRNVDFILVIWDWY